MKRIFFGIVLLVGIVATLVCIKLFTSATKFKNNSKSIIVHENETNKESLIKILEDSSIISDITLFEIVGNQFNIWDKIKPGKFKFNKGASLLEIIKKFKNNNQQEINLVINKIRQPQDLAKLIGKNFSTDSATAYSIIIDSNIVTDLGMFKDSFLFNIIPNTYQFYYHTSVQKILEKLAVESKKFWDNNNRIEKAKSLGYSIYDIYTLASIVEEETNKDDEKGNVASVYMNRLNKNMRLEADPTVKFALKDFTIKRIIVNHLSVNSPYNTYRNSGLPPGAICTPSIKTIDAVLNAPSTDYIFFCADSSLNGYHKFANNYAQHQVYANQYHIAVSKFLAKENTNP